MHRLLSFNSRIADFWFRGSAGKCDERQTGVMRGGSSETAARAEGAAPPDSLLPSPEVPDFPIPRFPVSPIPQVRTLPALRIRADTIPLTPLISCLRTLRFYDAL